eukprot:1195366-Prorocentrum_minimum.AAC.3
MERGKVRDIPRALRRCSRCSKCDTRACRVSKLPDPGSHHPRKTQTQPPQNPSSTACCYGSTFYTVESTIKTL